MAEEIRRMRQKYGTTTQWSTANPILTKGEIGFEDLEDGSWLAKLGDGSTAWDDLPYHVNMSNAIPRDVVADYTLVPTDVARDIYVNSPSPSVVTIPADDVSIPVYSQIAIWRMGNGSVVVEGDTGVSLNGVSGGSLQAPSKYSVVFLQKLGANSWQGVNNSYGINELRVSAVSTTLTTIDVELHLSGATSTVLLPPLVDVPVGKFYYIKDLVGTGVQTISADGLDTINGASSYVMVDLQTIRLVNNGIEWALEVVTVSSDDVPNQSTVPGVTMTDVVEYLDINTLVIKSTHVEYGGAISINVDPTKAEIAPGSVVIVDSHTDDQNPTAVRYSWTSPIVYDPPLLATEPLSNISMGVGGTILNTPRYPTSLQRRSYAVLGGIVHEDNVSIRLALTYPVWGQDMLGLTTDLLYTLGGTLNVEGNVITDNGATLSIVKTAGRSMSIGINKGIDAEDPNTTTDPIQIAPTMITYYRGGAGVGIPAFSSLVPVSQYDPNGDGSLVNIPTGYFVNHRIYFDGVSKALLLVYGQFAYDSLKKAIDSAEREGFIPVSETVILSLRCVLSVRQGATDLSDRTQSKFTEAGILGEKAFQSTPSFSRFAESVELVDALSYQRPSITFDVDTGVVYAEVEADGGGDINYVFGQQEYDLDCTTGAGTGGKARIALTAGTAISPQRNWVYVIRTGDVAVLQSSTAEPTGEYGMVLTALIPDVTSFTSDGAYVSRRWTNAKEIDGIGVVATILRKLRGLPVDYISGLFPALTINTVPAPDELDLTITSGMVRQVYDQTTDALQLSVNGALVVNDETLAYTKITDLNEISTDSTGGSLQANNTYYQLIIAVSANVDGSSRLLINKPSGSYSSAADAFNDVNAYSNTTFPLEFDSLSLVCALVLRYQSGGVYTNAASAFGVDFIDLRGQNPGASAQGSGAASVTEFSSSNFRVFDPISSNDIAFDLTALTAARTVTVPDSNVTLLKGVENLTTQYRMAVVGAAGTLTESSSITTDAGGNLSLEGGFTVKSNLDSVGALSQIRTDGFSGLGYFGVEGSTSGTTLPGTLAFATFMSSGANNTSFQLGSSGSIKATLNPAGQFLIGTLIEFGSEKLGVEGSAYVRGSITADVAATQDAIAIAGRAGGTGSYVGTITPGTLTASRTYTMPDESGTVALERTLSRATAYVSTPAATASITAGTPVNLLANSTIAAGNVAASADITIDDTLKRLTYTGTPTKTFEITITGSTISSASGVDLEVFLSADGSLVTSSEQRQYMTTGSEIVNWSVTEEVTLATNGYVESFVDLSSGTGTVTPTKLTFKIKELR